MQRADKVQRRMFVNNDKLWTSHNCDGGLHMLFIVNLENTYAIMKASTKERQEKKCETEVKESLDINTIKFYIGVNYSQNFLSETKQTRSTALLCFYLRFFRYFCSWKFFFVVSDQAALGHRGDRKRSSWNVEAQEHSVAVAGKQAFGKAFPWWNSHWSLASSSINWLDSWKGKKLTKFLFFWVFLTSVDFLGVWVFG